MENNIKAIRLILSVLLLIVIIYLLQIFAFLLIPITFALFITLFSYPSLKWLEKRKIPFIISLFILISGCTFVIIGMTYLINITGAQIALDQDNIKDTFILKFNPIIEWIDSLQIFKANSINSISAETLMDISHNIFLQISDLASSLVLTIIFLFIFLSGISKIDKYLYFIANDENRYNKYIGIFNDVVKSLSGFLIVKFFVSLLTAISIYIICEIFSIDFALFWAVITFILSFIQIIGASISTIIICLFAYLQIDTLSIYILFCSIVIGLQLILGNFLEPYLMGKQFSINTASIIIGLILCSYIWGIAGAILTVPILVLIKEIIDKSSDKNILSKIMGITPKNEQHNT